MDVFSAILGPLCKNFKLEKMVIFAHFFWFHCFLPKKQRVSVCESFLGRFGPYFRVTPPGGVLSGARRVKSKFLVFPGHCAAVTFPILVQNDLFRLIFTIFDLSRPLEGRLAHYLRVRARYGCRGVCGGVGLAWWAPCAARNR